MLQPVKLECRGVVFLVNWGVILQLQWASLIASPPRYDHVVIVIEENRTPSEIMGDTANAPYINWLGNNGVWLKSMFAVEHPSQPNYLQLFSGSNQGVFDDELPPNFSTVTTGTYPFRTSNLGANLLKAGFTFAGYSEELESAGNADWATFNPHSTTTAYRRKHNPWANWVVKGPPTSAFHLTSSVNRAFTQFPTNFTDLPTVSFVVPNQLNDMHDGSRRMGDDWLRANLDAYAVWARTHNSLLVVTWDEDDYSGNNRIVTLFHGANLRDGTVASGTWTHHNLLRTMEDMYGLTNHSGTANQVRSIVGPFVTDPVVQLATFRQGLNGYTNASDTMLWQQHAATNYARAVELTVDLDTSSLAGNQVGQALLRFESLIGNGPNQVPPTAIVHSAKLLLQTPLNTTVSDFASYDLFRLHRMIIDWDDSATWSSLVAGVTMNNAEAATASTFSLVPSVDGGPAIFDVTLDMELFKGGTPNRGWVMSPPSSSYADGWTFKSSETAASTLRPTLEVVYSLPSNPYETWASAIGLTSRNYSVNSDPDQDGANNLAEFAYNMNPVIADARRVTPLGASGLPAAHLSPGLAGALFEVQFLRRKGASSAGLSYVVQFSDDLTKWTEGQPPIITSLGEDWDAVTVRDAAPASDRARFARVVVTLQP